MQYRSVKVVVGDVVVIVVVCCVLCVEARYNYRVLVLVLVPVEYIIVCCSVRKRSQLLRAPPRRRAQPYQYKS